MTGYLETQGDCQRLVELVPGSWDGVGVGSCPHAHGVAKKLENNAIFMVKLPLKLNLLRVTMYLFSHPQTAATLCRTGDHSPDEVRTKVVPNSN